jgi:hypothetical protein
MTTTAWIAGSVRARALVRRRIGPARARQIAACPGAVAAVAELVETPYGHDVHIGQTRTEAEWGIGATLLWHLRVLAGWLPPGGVEPVRVLAGWFEVANVEEHILRIEGRSAAPPYRLGALATAWPRLAAAENLEGVRAVLAASPWGDPGSAQAPHIAVAMRVGWAERVIGAVPDARRWASGAVALLAAREAARIDLPGPLAHRIEAIVGTGTFRAGSLPALAAEAVARAGWTLAGHATPQDLWRAEADWWRHVDRGGVALLGRHRFGPRVVVGAIAVLAADAWRTRAALACAARGGAVEVFDEVA